VISKQKKVLYGAALAISSGLFANEVVNATQREEPPEPIERPAEAELAGGATEVLSAQESTVNSAPPDVFATHEAPVQKDPLAALEAALSKLGAADAAATDDSEPETPRQRRKRAPAEEPSASDVEPAPEPAPRLNAAARAERRARIEELFEEEPLVGIVSGPDGTVALVGGRSVRVGDVLGDGETRVLDCTTTGLRVDFENEPAWIPLPGLRAQVKAPQAQGGAATPAPVPRAIPQDTGTSANGGSTAAASGSQGGQP
jgi:hypothetical protein